MSGPTFTWSIPTVEHETATGCITVIHWRMKGSDGTNAREVYGTVNLAPKDPTDPSFVAYDKVTEAQAITWAQAALGADQVAAYERALMDQLAALASPATAVGVPW